MRVNHHPSDALMLDYAAGNIGPAAELAITSHLTFCPRCRRTNRMLESVGGRFVAEIADPPLVVISAEKTLVGANENGEQTPSAVPPGSILPAALRSILGCDADSLPWKRLGMGAFQYIVPVNDPVATARLLRIPAARPVPVHAHRGTELTLVLSGAFSDVTGAYARGDLQEADESVIHQPHAAAGADCICLAVTDAPLRFQSWAARLVQPILGI